MRGIRVVVVTAAVILGATVLASAGADEKCVSITGTLSERDAASSLMASLTLVLQSQGVRTDYTKLMGNSGAAFRAALDDRWDFGSMDIYFGFDFLKLALEAYGCGFERVPDGEKSISEAVKKAVDAGMPAIGVVSGVGQFGIITGYASESGEIVVREYGSGEMKCIKPTPDKASNVFIPSKTGESLPPAQAVRKGLEHAVRLWKEAKEAGCAWGAAAYEKWIADLRDQAKIDELSKGFPLAAANAYIFRCYQDARTQAVEYLKRHANDLGPTAAPHLLEAARQYGIARDQFKVPPLVQGWDAAVRERQAKQLEAALAAERKGIEEIEAALAAK